MNFSILTYVGPPLLLILAALMVRRRLYREFPFFFSYILAVVVIEVIRFVPFRLRLVPTFFYVYWITEAVEVALGFLVLYEVFIIAAFPRFSVTRVFRRLFPIVGLVILALATWMFLGAPSNGPSKIVVLVGRFSLALNFCQVMIMMFFGVLIIFMSREWRRHEMGIATGFGVNAAVKLLMAAHWAGNSFAPTRTGQLPTISYLIAVLIWLFYLSKSDPEPKLPELTEEMVEQAERAHADIQPMLRKLRGKRWR